MRRTLYLTFAVFMLQALPFGGWLALIPYVKEALGLNKAELAFALLGMSIGVLPALQLAGWLIGRVGPRRLMAVSFPLQALGFALPLLAVGQKSLFAALFVLGCIFAMMQVSLNVYAGRLEKVSGRIVMNRCHGFWGAGIMLGSLGVALLLNLGPLTALWLIGIPSAIAGTVAALGLTRFAGQDGGSAPPRRPFSALPRRLLYIAVCTLAVSMAEGSMLDWSAVYLAERLSGDLARAGIAVSIFSGALAVGRFSGDAVNKLVGPVALARGGLALVGLGLLMLVVPLPLWTAYLGFAAVGLGASVGFPLGISAAAGIDDRYEGPNIAVVSTVTSLGFLIGPPMIGSLAEIFSLRVGLAALLPGICVGFVLARHLGQGDSAEKGVNRVAEG